MRNKREISELQAGFTRDNVLASLYSGVEEFYSILRAQKFYMTRNIYPVAFAFGSVLGFSGVFAEEDNKSKRLENFIKACPYFQKYILKGDSVIDEEMNDVLKFYKKCGLIKDAVGMYISKKPKESQMNPEFEMNLGRDYTALVDFVNYGPVGTF